MKNYVGATREEANRQLRGDDRGFREPFTIPEHL
jgi:hypothetical protein